MGWTASIEAAADADDHGGWRADVLATGPMRRRIALEVQLAPMTASIGCERASLYRRDGVESVWLTPGNPQWVLKIPTLAFRTSWSLAETNLEQMSVVRGLWRLSRGGRLEPRGGSPSVADVLSAVLAGRLQAFGFERGKDHLVAIVPADHIELLTRQPAVASDGPESNPSIARR